MSCMMLFCLWPVVLLLDASLFKNQKPFTYASSFYVLAIPFDSDMDFVLCSYSRLDLGHDVGEFSNSVTVDGTLASSKVKQKAKG